MKKLSTKIASMAQKTAKKSTKVCTGYLCQYTPKAPKSIINKK